MDKSDATQCDDLTRALGLSHGPLEGALAEHVETCAACARLAERSSRFEALWEASRPATPTDAFGPLWSDVTARAEAASRLSVASAAGPSRRFRHRLRFAALILAQAAAVLVGVLLLTQDRVRAHTLVALNETVPKVIDIEPSEVLVLRSKAASAQLERLEFEELRLSDTETVSLDTSLLAYFEAREGN